MNSNDERGPDVPDIAPLITGELDPDSNAGQAALRKAGISTDELEGLRELAGTLDAAAFEREEIGMASNGLKDAPGSGLVLATIEKLASDSTTKSGPGVRNPGFNWPWILTVAAALMLIPFFLQTKQSGREQMLGDYGVSVRFTEERPRTLDGYGPIGFEARDPITSGQFTLLVFGASGNATSTPLFTYTLGTSPWSDSDEQLRWPDSVRVRVELRIPGISEPMFGWAQRSRD